MMILYYIFRYFKTKIKEDKPKKTANSDSDSNDSSYNDYLKDYEEDLYLPNIDKSEKSDDLANTDLKKNREQNVSYNLFTIGPTESPEHERIINGVKEYQMLVRTKIDGIEVRLFSCFY